MTKILSKIANVFGKALFLLQRLYNLDTGEWENAPSEGSGMDTFYGAPVGGTDVALKTVATGKKLLIYAIHYSLGANTYNMRVFENGTTQIATLETETAKKLQSMVSNKPIWVIAAGSFAVDLSDTGTGYITCVGKEVDA